MGADGDIEGIAARLQDVQARMAAATAAAGRPADDVRLLAVSKFHPMEAVCAAYDAGQRDFGENIVQEMVAKAAAVAATGRRPRWHFIGHLQRNKVGAVLGTTALNLVQSVDRPELVEAMAKRTGVTPLNVLIQVNIGREAQKSGVDPQDLLDLARRVDQHKTLNLRGLMAVPPADVDPEPYFRDLAAILATLQQDPCGRQATELSMGMSHDYEAAIRCGATLVRVGTAIFGQR